MAISDTIGDFLTVIRNASRAKHRYVDAPWSVMNEEIVKILEAEGFVEGYRTRKDGTIGLVRIYLRYDSKRQSVLHQLSRVSKPGCRRYVKAREIPTVLGGMGMSVISTSKGLMPGHKARQAGIGGEILCTIY